MKFLGVVSIACLALSVSGCKSTDNLTQTINEEIAQNANAHGISASSVVVLHNGEYLYQGQTGTMHVGSPEIVQNDSIFPIYSVAKLLASTAIFQLVEQGKIDLSDHISKHLSGLPKDWQQITIAQLLSHASGLPEFYRYEKDKIVAPNDIQSAIQNTFNKPLEFVANSETKYNQTNYLLLRQIIESYYQQSYEQVIKAKILEPAGLNSTYLNKENVPKHRLVEGYGPNYGESLQVNTFFFPSYANSVAGVYATADDLGRFLSVLAQGKLVSQQLLMSVWQSHQLINDISYYASGWPHDKVGKWQHVGHDGGAMVRVRLLYQDNLDEFYVIVYLTNGNKDGVWSGSLINSVQYHVLPDLLSRLATRAE